MISANQLKNAFNGQLNINPGDLKTLNCENCNNDKFDQVFIIKKIPALLSPTGKQILLPIPVFECTECHHVSKEMFPEELEKNATPAKTN
tara:strand:- start:2009 stop:2278 length:270 start_codon:yes stop_codon:yes gene_type:complete